MKIDIDNWNRKDANPSETVENIKKILKEQGIDTHIVDIKQYDDQWASTRIEIDALNGIGSNGKGVGLPYTMASAYGELIERIQGGSLVAPLFNLKGFSSENKENNYKHVALMRKYFDSATKMYSDEELFNMLNAYPEMKQTSYYYDTKTCETVEIPERFLGFVCGTNGIASGNTYEEAFCQGLCEIFERYVMKKIYSESPKMEWPTIPRELYLLTNSMKMIEAIEKKGYSCIVKNCTMGGKLPVVGILVLDSTKTKYLFRLGSDLNFDLALQRCITEVFQGINFDMTFRMQMQSIFIDNKKECSIWNYKDPTEGVTRAITVGAGVLPYTMFFNNESDSLQPFIMENDDTNVTMLDKLLNIFKKLGARLFIRDCSFLGFPTLRMFVPEFSDAYYYENNMDYLPVLMRIGNLSNILQEQKGMYSANSAEKILETLLIVRNYETFKYNTTLNKFTGICFGENYPREIHDIDYIIGLLALALKKYKCAKEYLRNSYMLDSYIKNTTYEYVTLIVDAIENHISHNTIIEVLNELNVSDDIKNIVNLLYDVHENGYVVFCCNDCKHCKYVDICSYNYWDELNMRLKKAEMNYIEKQPYKLSFYRMISKKINNDF